MNSEQNLTREKAIATLNTPDEQLNELIERAGALRKKYKGNHVSIHLLTNARSGNCSQNCAYCAQSCRSHADIETVCYNLCHNHFHCRSYVHCCSEI